MMVPVDRADSQARELAENLARLADFNDELPASIFHYTTAAGFEGIIRTRSIWATNVFFLNDPSEIQYGLNLALELIRAHVRDRSARSHQFLNRLPLLLEQALSDVYVASFSELADDLSQWRAYGSAAGSKFSVGFDAVAIRRAVLPSRVTEFARVVYDTAQQKRWLGQLLDTAFKSVLRGDINEQCVTDLTRAAASTIARVVALLKTPAYAAEKEWRIVVFAREFEGVDVKFDTSRGVIRPYLIVPLQTHALAPVVRSVHVLAPSRPKTALKAAEIVLHTGGIYIDPVYSAIPFAD